MKKKVSIDDIARETGFSRGTVSRAFNERSDINAKTREMILEKAVELDYYPDRSARGLAKGSSECIGIVVPDLLNPFLPEMITAIERQLRRRDWSCLLAITDDDIKVQQKVLQRLAAGQVDGVMITPVESENSIQQLNRVNRRIPVLCLKAFSGFDGPSIAADDQSGIGLMVEHLVSSGHQRILYLHPEHPPWTAKERSLAFVKAAGIHGVKSPMLASIPGSGMNEDVQILISSIFKNRGKKDLPTAIFAFDDIIAVRAIHALRALNYRIPEDIVVAGFDNIALADQNGFDLTTIATDRDQLAETALQELFRKLKPAEKAESPGMPNPVPVKLLIRHSTAPINTEK